MRWQGRRESGNVVDRRGMRVGALGGGGIVVALLYFLFTGDPSAGWKKTPKNTKPVKLVAKASSPRTRR